MRNLFASVMAIVMLFGLVQDTKPFTYKMGSTMEYKDTRFGPDGSSNDHSLTWTVTKLDGDKTYVESANGATKNTFVFSYVDGFFCWGNIRGNEATVGLRVFKVGAKKGDTWAPEAGSDTEMKLTYVGEEETTVQGGKFTAKKVVFAGDGQFRVTFWLVDKVGLIKATREYSLDGAEFNMAAKIELQKFVEGK